MVSIVGRLKPISPAKEVQLFKGNDGVAGKEGKAGRDGKDGVGKEGKEGMQGIAGSVPENQVSNGEIRFKQPDGAWGSWITVQPNSGGGGNMLSPIQEATLDGMEIGDQKQDGSWRFITNGTALDVERLEGGVWILKGGFTA